MNINSYTYKAKSFVEWVWPVYSRRGTAIHKTSYAQ